MVYYGTSNTETIWFGPAENIDEVHYIELHKPADESVFYVTTCCNEDWVWAFKADVTYNYEVVKYTIMDAVTNCCCMNKLFDVLDEIFEEEFADILADDNNDESACECDVNCCEQCNCRDCLE